MQAVRAAFAVQREKLQGGRKEVKSLTKAVRLLEVRRRPALQAASSCTCPLRRVCVMQCAPQGLPNGSPGSAELNCLLLLPGADTAAGKGLSLPSCHITPASLDACCRLRWRQPRVRQRSRRLCPPRRRPRSRACSKQVQGLRGRAQPAAPGAWPPAGGAQGAQGKHGGDPTPCQRWCTWIRRQGAHAVAGPHWQPGSGTVRVRHETSTVPRHVSGSACELVTIQRALCLRPLQAPLGAGSSRQPASGAPCSMSTPCPAAVMVQEPAKQRRRRSRQWKLPRAPGGSQRLEMEARWATLSLLPQHHRWSSIRHAVMCADINGGRPCLALSAGSLQRGNCTLPCWLIPEQMRGLSTRPCSRHAGQLLAQPILEAAPKRTPCLQSACASTPHAPAPCLASVQPARWGRLDLAPARCRHAAAIAALQARVAALQAAGTPHAWGAAHASAAQLQAHVGACAARGQRSPQEGRGQGAAPWRSSSACRCASRAGKLGVQSAAWA